MVDLALEHVAKRYRLRNPESGGSPLRRLAGRLFPGQHDFWALRDVSFDVAHGETVAIIGHNGAGKSTVMKLVSGITAPTEGEIRIRGKVAALIELGSGFHPELTGRENVFLSGAILGMRRREVASKFDSIIDFAGIGEFVDVPVKWYSSGMYVRLGFAIAAHIDVEILLVDEVLAVGDAAFQSKCFARIADLKSAGTTILMITHDLAAVERLADRAVLLDHGRLVALGAAREVVARYERALEGATDPQQPSIADEAPIVITDVTIDGDGVAGRPSATTGRHLSVTASFTVRRQLRRPIFKLLFYSFHDGVLQTQCTGAANVSNVAGSGTAVFDIPALGLQPGVYTLGVTVTEEGEPKPCAWHFGRSTLYVEGDSAGGRFYMPHNFTLTADRVSRTAQAAECPPGRDLVSIVIPCYNQAAFLPDAIRSALQQRYQPVEVIVVDDGSDEDIRCVVACFPGVKYVRQPNLGVAGARNRGLQESGGRFLVFLDSDDMLGENAVVDGLEILAATEGALAAVGLCRVIGPGGEPQPFRQQGVVADDAYPELLRGNFIWMPGQVLHRRETVEKMGGFDTTVNACADYDLYLRIARDGRLACHRRIVAEYRQHAASMSANAALMLRSVLAVLERQTPYVREKAEYRKAQAAGRRFWRDFYGEVIVEGIRVYGRQRGSRVEALRLAATLVRYDPSALAFHLGRKFWSALFR